MGRPPIGTRAMTGAERVQRYRQRHAQALAKNEHTAPPRQQSKQTIAKCRAMAAGRRLRRSPQARFR